MNPRHGVPVLPASDAHRTFQLGELETNKRAGLSNAHGDPRRREFNVVVLVMPPFCLSPNRTRANTTVVGAVSDLVDHRYQLVVVSVPLLVQVPPLATLSVYVRLLLKE